MQNIWDAFQFIKFVADKQINSAPTPAQASSAFTQGQQILYRIKLDAKDAGDDKASTALIPFRKNPTLTSTSTGVVAYPTDYANAEGIYKDIDGVHTQVVIVTEDELDYALQSAVYPIARHPRYREQGHGIQVYPKTTHTVELNYLIKAPDPVIGFTVSGNAYVYDANTSVQLTFGTNYYIEVILKSLPFIGVSLSDKDLQDLYVMFNAQTTQR